MIVKCEQCQTRFKIPDEKVTDKGVKVRCTKCQHTFRVYKEGSAPASTQQGMPALGAVAPTQQHPALGAPSEADPFAQFGAPTAPPPEETTRPAMYAFAPAAQKPLEPSFAAQADLPSEAFDSPTRVARMPAPPPGRKALDEPSDPEVPAVPPPPAPGAFDFSALGAAPPAPGAFDFAALDHSAPPQPQNSGSFELAPAAPPQAGGYDFSAGSQSQAGYGAEQSQGSPGGFDFGPSGAAPQPSPGAFDFSQPPADPFGSGALGAPPPAAGYDATTPGAPFQAAPAGGLDPFAGLAGQPPPPPPPSARRPQSSAPLEPAATRQSPAHQPAPLGFGADEPTATTTPAGRGLLDDLPDAGSPTTNTEERAALFDMPPPAPTQQVPVVEQPPLQTQAATPLGALKLVKMPAGAAKPAEAPARPVVEPKKVKVGSIVVNVVIAAALVGLLTVVGSAFFNEGKLEGAFSWERIKGLISAPSDLVAVDISNGLYDTKAGRPLFYVRGEVKNRGADQPKVKVRAEIFEGDQLVRAAEGWAGASPTPEDLFAITRADDLDAMLKRLAASPAPLKQGEKATFVVPFFEYPPDLKAFRVRVTVVTGERGETAAR